MHEFSHEISGYTLWSLPTMGWCPTNQCGLPLLKSSIVTRAQTFTDTSSKHHHIFGWGATLWNTFDQCWQIQEGNSTSSICIVDHEPTWVKKPSKQTTQTGFWCPCSCWILLLTTPRMLEWPTRTAPAKHFFKRSPFSFMSSPHRENWMSDLTASLAPARIVVDKQNSSQRYGHSRLHISPRQIEPTSGWQQVESRISPIQYGAVVFNLINLQWFLLSRFAERDTPSTLVRSYDQNMLWKSWVPNAKYPHIPNHMWQPMQMSGETPATQHL